MFSGSSCIPDERAKELEYITKPPLVLDAYQAVKFFAFFPVFDKIERVSKNFQRTLSHPIAQLQSFDTFMIISPVIQLPWIFPVVQELI